MLKPKARDARGPGRTVDACYLRDRDFDTDPPDDLMAALDVTVYRSFADNPTVLRRKLRDWVRNNPDVALATFPERQSLVTLLRA